MIETKHGKVKEIISKNNSRNNFFYITKSTSKHFSQDFKQMLIIIRKPSNTWSKSRM